MVFDEVHPSEPFVALTPQQLLDHAFDDVHVDQVEINRRDARRARGIAEAVELARRHAYVYSDLPGDAGEAMAERGAYFEMSLRLALSETTLRALAGTARNAARLLPGLWQRATDGFAALSLIDAATTGALRLQPAPDATRAEISAAAAATRELDDAASEWVLTCTPASFRARLARLVDRLDARRAEARHATAMRDRRVVIEHVDNGMSWVSALIPTVDAVAVGRRLTATAKAIAKGGGETRRRDQVRADLFVAWLRGEGTATAVKTTVFVTVPVTLLAGDTTVPVSREQAQLVGHGPIDPLTAAQLFFEAKAFRRVITDPVRGIILDMDRRTYRPTKAQRDWLVLTHGRCARDGCTRLALDADLDHDRAWARGGTTDTSNLRPLCPPDHTRRHKTRFRFVSRRDGTVEVTTPTGFTTSPPPPF
jgi:hypothetical protein